MWLAPLLLLLAPLQSTEPLTRVAFGSCARQDRPQPVWGAVSAFEPELLVLLGDNMYGDSDDPEVLRAGWEALAAVPGFRALRERVPLLATWDDHDYGRNDAGAEFTAKVGSQRVFLDFLGVPADSPRRAREGVYHAETFGPEGRRVQVILLDTRYHRSALRVNPEGRVGSRGPYVPDDDAGATVLGEEQWAWLGERLREPAEVRLVATSIQLVSADHGWETWGNFPRERERFLRLVRETKAAGVVLLSGDRHSAEISILPPDADGPGPRYPLVDVTASSFNSGRGPGEEANPYRTGAVYFEPNFGTLEIDWDATSPRLTLTLRNVEGEPVLGHGLSLADLRP